MQEYLKYFISYVVRIDGVPCMSNGLIDRPSPIITYEDIKEVEEDIRIEQKADSALLISFSC